MADCRRMPQEELTGDLARRLRAHGLTAGQVVELYRHSRAYLARMRQTAREQREAENDVGGDADMASVKFASVNEAEQYGVKLPEKEKATMKFHEGLDAGMAPAKALETCERSRLKDITVERLQACVDAGLSKDEIAKGFGTTLASLKWQASQIKFKFPKGGVAPVSPENTKPEIVQGGGTDMQPEQSVTPAAATLTPEELAKHFGCPPSVVAHAPTVEELAELFGVDDDQRLSTASDDTTVQQLLDALHNSDGPITFSVRCITISSTPRKVYVAHPLRGAALEDNIAAATEICRRYAERRDIIPFSPIHCFGYLDPMTYDQEHGMKMCYALLDACDELWVHGAWWDSEGCQLEMRHAGRKGIPIRFVPGAPGHAS